MLGEPDFCRDILETRIKGILKEHLKISRDITFLQVRPDKCDTMNHQTILSPVFVSF